MSRFTAAFIGSPKYDINDLIGNTDTCFSFKYDKKIASEIKINYLFKDRIDEVFYYWRSLDFTHRQM